MPKRSNLLGQKFSMLTVTCWNDEFKKWLCKCECGNECLRQSSALARRQKTTKSCGCKWLRKIRPNHETAKHRMLYGYKRGAKVRNLSFELTEDDFFYLISLSCHYCQSPPMGRYPSRGSENGFAYNGIDRVDNDVGYIKENCVTCCKNCNRSKFKLTLNDWKLWIKNVYENTVKSS